MPDRYPGYDVLAKRNTLSWNDKTREIVDRRLSIDPETHLFFTAAEWQALRALCDRIVPQPGDRPPVPLAAMVDRRMHEDDRDGYRHVRMPKMQDAWRSGLAALDDEAQQRHGLRFHLLSGEAQDALLHAMERGDLTGTAWGKMSAQAFFKHRVVLDIVKSYYAHPTAWSEVGWGGPASPRGYVRLDFDRRDPWEAAEAKNGREDAALKENRRVGR